jgi:hypothetical protein
VNPSRLFILQPVATTLLTVAVLLAGGVAYTQLPISALPQVDYPTIQVLTFYPGASPDVMASSVTSPLERQFGQLPGLNQMTSTGGGRAPRRRACRDGWDAAARGRGQGRGARRRAARGRRRAAGGRPARGRRHATGRPQGRRARAAAVAALDVDALHHARGVARPRGGAGGHGGRDTRHIRGR